MQKVCRFQFVLILFSFVVALQPAFAQHVIATVPTGTKPYAVAANSVTNKIYVANDKSNTVTVIDGATNNATTVNAGEYPNYVVVNPVTNKIYVANLCGSDPYCLKSGTVTVIDGATNNTALVSVGYYPYAMVVDSLTNKIYVANLTCWGNPPCTHFGTVTVIDGVTNNTQTLNVGVYPHGVALDPVTNQIYVVNKCGTDLTCNTPGTVTIIDGASNNLTTVNVGGHPEWAAVNSITNKIYVTDNCGNDLTCKSLGTVTVIDGATNNTQTVNVGAFPWGAAVDAVTNKVYVTNHCGTDPTCSGPGTVTVIDGATNNPTTVNVGAFPYELTADVVTNKIYVVNTCGNDLTCQSIGSVSVIDGTTNAVVPVEVGHTPGAINSNVVTNKIYVTNDSDSTVSVIAGANSDPLQFVAVTPCRVVDTRNPTGPFGGPALPAGSSRSFPIPQGSCNIPASAAAVSLNVTVVPQGSLGYLTIWPTGEDQPVVSTMNSLDGRVKANAAIVPSGYLGGVSVYVTNTLNLVLDIDGYFAPVGNSTLAFYPLTPCRVADTRDASKPAGLGPPHLTGKVAHDFPVLSSTCNIPNTAQAYSLNFTAVPYPARSGNPLGYLEVWPTGEKPQYPVSTLNNPTGTAVANAAIVPAGTGGDITAYPSADTDLVIDVNGYFAPAGQGGLSLYPAAPCRVLDTRKTGNGQPFSGTLTPAVDVVDSVCAPPSAAQAYVFNATVIPAGSLGYLTLWPDSEQQPVVSTLNAADGAIASNMAIVPTSNGKVDAFASSLTQLLLDISSYFAP